MTGWLEPVRGAAHGGAPELEGAVVVLVEALRQLRRLVLLCVSL